MERVEVNIVILNDNPNIEISFKKDNQVVLWDDLTIPEKTRIVNAFAGGYGLFGGHLKVEEEVAPKIELRDLW